MPLFRRRRPTQLEPEPSPAPAAASYAGKPYLVTIHADHGQHHTFAMGPGDAVGVDTIRIDIDQDGHIHATPDQPKPDTA